MELLHRRCCGLDVHKETVVACLRLVSDGKMTPPCAYYCVALTTERDREQGRTLDSMSAKVQTGPVEMP